MFSVLLVVLLVLLNNVNSFNMMYKQTKHHHHHNNLNINMISSFDHNNNDMINQLLSKDVIQVFQLMKRNPTSFIPNKEQAIALFNNLNRLIGSDSLSDTSKFYESLHKSGVIKAYGSMNQDGPLNSLKLPHLEHMLYTDPPSIFREFDIDSEHVENLDIPNYNTKGYTASTYSTKDDDVKTAYHSLIVASLQTILSISLKDTFFDPSMVILSIGLLLSGIVIDGPTMFDGMFSRQLAWSSFRVSTLLNADERKKDTRRNAATFLVAYLVGTPIKRFESNINDLNPSSFFMSPYGPKVDLQDPSLHSGQSTGALMDSNGLNRLSATFMASYAVDAFDGSKVRPLSNYIKNLLAIIGLRSSKPIYSNIPSKDFPQKLIPTMTIWGFLQSSLILREVGSKVLDAVVEVFENGGGVGDAIFAIEANLPDNYMNASPTATRYQIRKMTEESFSRSKRSIVSTLATILEARAIPNDEAAINDSEISLIPGTDRTFTRDELILRSNPSMADVDECAKTLMHLLSKVDKKKFGRVQRETHMKIKDIASQVMDAKLALEINKVENEIINDQILQAQVNKEISGIHYDTKAAYERLGLSSSFATFLVTNSNPFVDNLIDPLIDVSNVKKFVEGNINKLEEWWLFYGSVIFEHTLGITNKKFIISIWDAANISTGIEDDGASNLKDNGMSKKMAEMTTELKNIVKAGYDTEADALLAKIKNLSQKKEWRKMIDEEKGTFNTFLSEQADANMIRLNQINERISELKNKL